MYENANKYGLVIAVVVAIAILIISGLTYSATEKIDLLIISSYLLIFIAAGAAIFLPLINSLSEPKKLIRIGVGILAIALVFLITYLPADGEMSALYTRIKATEGSIKTAGALLTTTWVLLGATILSVFYSEISKAFK